MPRKLCRPPGRHSTSRLGLCPSSSRPRAAGKPGLQSGEASPFAGGGCHGPFAQTRSTWGVSAANPGGPPCPAVTPPSRLDCRCPWLLGLVQREAREGSLPNRRHAVYAGRRDHSPSPSPTGQSLGGTLRGRVQRGSMVHWAGGRSGLTGKGSVCGWWGPAGRR